jgi:hypothetical protein
MHAKSIQGFDLHPEGQRFEPVTAQHRFSQSEPPACTRQAPIPRRRLTGASFVTEKMACPLDARGPEPASGQQG